MSRIIFAFFLLLLLGWFTPLFPQFHIDKGEANDLYAQHCASCHGKNLEGGQSSSLLDDEWKYGNMDAQLRNIIREGIPDTTMIPWKAVLTEDQIRAMVIYLRERARVTDRQALAQRRQPKGGIFTSDLHHFRMEKVVQGEGILWGFDFLPDGSILANQRSGIMWSEGMHRLTIEDGQVTGDEIIFGDQGRVRNTVYGPDGHIYLSISVGDPRVGAIYKLVPVD